MFDNPKKYYKDLLLITLGVILIYSYLIYVVRLIPGDDLDIREASMEYGLFYRIRWNYFNWSGRVVAKAYEWIFTRIPLSLWKCLNLAAHILTAFCLYFFAQVCQVKNRPALILLSVFGPLIMHPHAYLEASLWLTGSANFLFIVLPGLIGALVFYTDLYVKKVPQAVKYIVAILLLIPVSSSEQCGAVIITLLAIVLVHKAVKKTSAKELWFYYVCLGLYIVTLCLCTFLCPGNAARTAKEVSVWLPDFYTIGLKKRIIYSLRYVVNAFVNQLGYLPVLILAEEIICLFLIKEKKWYHYLTGLALLSAVALFVVKRFFPQFFDLRAEWGLESFSRTATVVFLYWSVIMLFVLVAVFEIGNTAFTKWCLFLLIGASIASIAVLCFSPTMYASGFRTKYVSSVILIITSLILAGRTDIKDHQWLVTGISLLGTVFGILNFIVLFSHLKDGFTFF